MPEVIERIVIGYGSESGNTRGLTQRLLRLPCVQPYQLAVQDLNSLDLEKLTPHDLLIIVCSSFGDGAPPGNADRFMDQLNSSDRLNGQPYAIFGLGDTAYPTFCGFTKSVDGALLEKKPSRGSTASMPTRISIAFSISGASPLPQCSRAIGVLAAP